MVLRQHIGLGVILQENAIERILKGGECLEADFGFQFTFPQRDAVPPHLGKSCFLLLVALFVTRDFLLPEFGVGLGHGEILASFVPMPEAPVDENACAVFPHHDIRMPWQTPMVEPIPEPSRKEIFPDNEFGFGILGVNGCHIVVAALLLERCHAVNV